MSSKTIQLNQVLISNLAVYDDYNVKYNYFLLIDYIIFYIALLYLIFIPAVWYTSVLFFYIFSLSSELFLNMNEDKNSQICS